MRAHSWTVRAATVGDIPALVVLRQANARVHLAFDPAAYRVPDATLVAGYFEGVLTAGREAVIVAADGSGTVVGMVEVLRLPSPPEHQILVPRPSAEIHTVVLPEARGRGIGARLVAAARDWAAAEGIRYLVARINHRNAAAVRFYHRHGFAGSGVSRTLELDG
jgi:GNAT superfamily N-acetyltransferase